MENPYLGSPNPGLAEQWAAGWYQGFGGAPSNPADRSDDAGEQTAYAEGATLGEQAAIDGLPLNVTCIPRTEEQESIVKEGVHVVGIGYELYAIIHEAAAYEVAGGILSAMVLLIELAIPSHHPLDPEAVLSDAATEPLLEALRSSGVEHLELYAGAGLDSDDASCEMMLTNVYPTLAQARDAVTSQGRSKWVIIGWRTDMSGWRTAEVSVTA